MGSHHTKHHPQTHPRHTLPSSPTHIFPDPAECRLCVTTLQLHEQGQYSTEYGIPRSEYDLGQNVTVVVVVTTATHAQARSTWEPSHVRPSCFCLCLSFRLKQAKAFSVRKRLLSTPYQRLEHDALHLLADRLLQDLECQQSCQQRPCFQFVEFCSLLELAARSRVLRGADHIDGH